MKDRKRARELADEFNRRDDPMGWFEVLYPEAEEGRSTVPWVDYHPTPHLVGFWMQHPQHVDEPEVRRFRVLFRLPPP
jgi:hypothetical protein